VSPLGHPGDASRRDEVVELAIPARPELLSLPRLVAAAVAARSGFDVEEVEDVRLAIEELCLDAFEGRGNGRLHIRIGMHPKGLEVECRFEALEGGSAPVRPRNELATELTRQLLDALADEHGRDESEGSSRTWFNKSHSNSSTE
jgi:hypothetical protein